MIKIDLKRHRKEIIGSVVVLLILLGGMSVFKYTSFNSGFEIVDDLGGNIFPSAILSVATTDAQVIVPSDSTSLGNPKSCIAVRLKSKTAYSRVRIEVAETPFFSRSVSEFVLNTVLPCSVISAVAVSQTAPVCRDETAPSPENGSVTGSIGSSGNRASWSCSTA